MLFFTKFLRLCLSVFPCRSQELPFASERKPASKRIFEKRKAQGIPCAFLFYLISSMPPIYILSASGILTEPSAHRLFSKKAMSILGGATTVLLSVCAK